MKRFATSLMMCLAVGSVSAKIEAPDHVLYGSVSLFGTPVPDGQFIELQLVSTGETLSRYQLGTSDQLGDQYALRIPMDTVEPRVRGRARPGDPVKVFIGTALAAETTVGGEGRAVRLDLDPQNLATGPSLDITDAEVFEGNGGTTPVVFDVTLNTTDPDDVVMFWQTQDDGATGGLGCTAGIDYIAETDRQLVFSPGETEASITIDVCADDVIEDLEQFRIDIVGVQNGVPSRDAALATIIDDDDVPTMTIADVGVIEPASGTTASAVFRPRLSKNSDFEVRLNYQTVALNAVPGVDYISSSGTVTFPPGDIEQEIPVTVLHAPGALPPRSFLLTFSAPFNVDIDDDQALAVINDRAFRPAVIPGQTVANGEGGVSGLAGPTALALSPDGSDAYATSEALDAVLHFRRNVNSGNLQLQSVYDAGRAGFASVLLGGALDIVVSPDGSMVYVAAPSDDAIAVLARNPSTGELSYVENQADGQLSTPDASLPNAGLAGVRQLLISADGAHLYAAGANASGLAVFARNPDEGSLSFLEAEISGVDDPSDAGGTVIAMSRPSGLAESPDGNQIYVASRFGDAVQIFERESDPGRADHGRLSFVEALEDGLNGINGLDGAFGLALSPDGTQLYVTAEAEDAVTLFDRDPSGSLTLRRVITKQIPEVPGLGGPQSIAVSADGLEVFVTGFADDSVTIFRRLIEEEDGLLPGDLVVRQTLFDDQGFVLDMAGPADLALSDDNAHLYVVANEDNAIVRFDRISLDVIFFDGFEDF